MKSNQKSKILILGGTAFVGRQLAEQLSKDASIDLYLFNRGKTNAGLFPNAHQIIGDRETKDIEQLRQHNWDYIFDFSSYFPKSLAATLAVINRNVKKYIYISTISVYDFPQYDGQSHIEETFPRNAYTEEQITEPLFKKYYGEKKAACEDILAAATWLPTIILRPSVIYGKYDPTDRFYYWLRKLKKEKHLLVPDHGKLLSTLSYSEDLVDLLKACIAGDIPNDTYNCTTHQPKSFLEILELMKVLLNSKCQLEMADGKWLRKEGVKIDQDLPLWYGGNLMVSNEKLRKQIPFQFRSFEDSVRSSIAYYESENWRPCAAGMSKEREDAVLAKVKGVKS